MPRKSKAPKTRKPRKSVALTNLQAQMAELQTVERHLPHDLRTGQSVRSLRTPAKISGYIKKMKSTLKNVRVINVPRPAPNSINKDRPLNTLIQTQVDHLKKLEATLPGAGPRRAALAAAPIRTEREAAEYIRMMTAKLHAAKSGKARK